jgi:fatty acid desaturase
MLNLHAILHGVLTMLAESKKWLRDAEAKYPLLCVIAYILITYVGGWWLLLYGNWGVFIPSVLILAHGMIISAYLMHECAHNSLFVNNTYNTRLGKQLNMLCGTNFGTYEDIRNKHLHHHVDNCDIVSFDYRSWLKKHHLILAIFKALEWMYIPIAEILMHTMQMVLPFVQNKPLSLRLRVARVIIVRFALLGLIAWYKPIALLGYCIAYMVFMTVLRFMDNFQHDYEMYYRLGDASFTPPMKGNVQYEQTHTYSNLISQRWPWLNLLTLNFAYHNAHHAKPTLIWFRLPALHAQMKEITEPQSVPFKQQLVSFHRQRVARVLSEDYGQEHVLTQINLGKAVGVNAVSFLTAF